MVKKESFKISLYSTSLDRKCYVDSERIQPSGVCLPISRGLETNPQVLK